MYFCHQPAVLKNLREPVGYTCAVIFTAMNLTYCVDCALVVLVLFFKNASFMLPRAASKQTISTCLLLGLTVHDLQEKLCGLKCTYAKWILTFRSL